MRADCGNSVEVKGLFCAQSGRLFSNCLAAASDPKRPLGDLADGLSSPRSGRSNSRLLCCFHCFQS